MRASYYFIGALLSRFRRARVELPGGAYRSKANKSAYKGI